MQAADIALGQARLGEAVAKQEVALGDRRGSFGAILLAERTSLLLAAREREVDVLEVPGGVRGHLRLRDLVQRPGRRHLVIAQQHACHHAGERPHAAGVRSTGLPLRRRRANTGRHGGLERLACTLKARERLGIGALHEGHAEQRSQRVIDAVGIPLVGVQAIGIHLPCRQDRQSISIHRQFRRQRRHALHDGARHLGLPTQRRMHVIIEQFPARGAFGREIAESLRHIAQHCALRSSGITDGLLGLAHRAPRHGVQIAGAKKGLPGTLRITRGELAACQRELRHGTARRTGGRRAKCVHGTGIRRIRSQAGQVGLARSIKPLLIVLAKRRKTRLVAGRGAHKRLHPRRLHVGQHALQIRSQIARRRRAQRRIRRDHRLPDHLLHQRAILVGALAQQSFDHLHQRQTPRRTHERQRPGWHGA